jgi:hypothetical protein
MSDNTPPPTTSRDSTGMNGFGPRQRSPLRFVLSTGIALGLIAILYLSQPGWFTTRIITGAAPGPTPTAGPTPPPTPTPKPKPAPPLEGIGGSHLSPDSIKITLEDVQYTRGGDGRVANQGDTFAVVTLLIENQRNQDWDLTPNVTCGFNLCNFYVQDTQGEKNPPVSFDPYHTALRAVVLQPRGHHKGSYTFEVPESDAAAGRLELLWYYQPFTDANNVQHWQLPRDQSHGR